MAEIKQRYHEKLRELDKEKRKKEGDKMDVEVVEEEKAKEKEDEEEVIFGLSMLMMLGGCGSKV